MDAHYFAPTTCTCDPVRSRNAAAVETHTLPCLSFTELIVTLIPCSGFLGLR
jgi:hypothetical protein